MLGKKYLTVNKPVTRSQKQTPSNITRQAQKCIKINQAPAIPKESNRDTVKFIPTKEKDSHSVGENN